MAENKSGKGRLRASYITSIVSITLVSFMLGLLGLIVIHGKKLTDHVRENFSISILLKDNASDELVSDFRKRLNQTQFVKTSSYISREQAAKELSSELGEDFVSFLGYNPLPASIDIQLRSGYANSDSIAHIEKILQKNQLVSEVMYQKSLIDQVNANIRKISLIIIGFSFILIVVSVVLIHNTIKLSIYSKRFLIRSMQLVGATESFVRLPFLKKSILQGIIASLLAIILLTATLWLAWNRIPELKPLLLFSEIGFFYIGIFVMGILLSASSTWFAVNKFLSIRVDKLYSN